jgi:two-component system, sensor histidine kinase RegB
MQQSALLWFVRLRWCGFFSQVLLFAAAIKFGERLAFWPLVTLSVLYVGSNLALAYWVRSNRIGVALTAGYLFLDIVLLSFSLYISGGPSNPFSIIYLVYIVLAAVLLDSRWTWIFAGMSSGCFALLFLFTGGGGSSHAHHMHAPDQALSLHLKGMLLAFIIAASLISYFLTRIIKSLRNAQSQIQDLEILKLKQQRLAALTTLAAGTAHDLGTPLSSIALAASELRLQAAEGGLPKEFLEDVDLIRTEVSRCKTLINQMSEKAGNVLGEMPVEFDLLELQQIVENALGPKIVQRLVVQRVGQVENTTLRLPKNALVRAILTLIQNAFAASDSEQNVYLRFMLDHKTLKVEIEDHGVGMSADTLKNLGQPFFSCRGSDDGMGLGVFLTQLTIDQLSGKLSFKSTLGRGTLVEFQVPNALGGSRDV